MDQNLNTHQNSCKNMPPPPIPKRIGPEEATQTGFSDCPEPDHAYNQHVEKKRRVDMSPPASCFSGFQQKDDVANVVNDSHVYYKRVMDIMQVQRIRPLDNNINFWKKFVELTFDPRTRIRHCYSKCNDVQLSAPTPQPGSRGWPCWLCKSKSVSEETVYKNLASMYQSRFGSEGVIDDMLSLSSPSVTLLKRGITIVNFGEAVMLRHFIEHQAILKGSFRVGFVKDKLQVVCWQFCTSSQEEYVSRRLLQPMVNNVVRCIEYSQGLDAEDDSNWKQEEHNYAMYHMFQNLRHLQNTMDQSNPHTVHANNLQEQNMQKTESDERDLIKPNNSAAKGGTT